jgi:hypothetical protein
VAHFVFNLEIKMNIVPKSTKIVSIIGWLVLLLGLSMVIYWIMYVVRKMPIGDIPILSESITAMLAFVTGFGLIRRKNWAVPCTLVLCGMWAYGVIGGIALVIQHGLSFDSPFASFTDALMFPLILLFAIWVAVTIWSNREEFRCAT